MICIIARGNYIGLVLLGFFILSLVFFVVFAWDIWESQNYRMVFVLVWVGDFCLFVFSNLEETKMYSKYQTLDGESDRNF